MKKHLIASKIIIILCLSIFILSGCGALLSVIIQAVLGTKLGFIAIPAIAAAKVTASQSEKNPGMIFLPHNNPPEGYEMAPGATVSIEGHEGTVTTDENGFFRFDDVPVGIRNLIVEHPEFVSIQQDVVVTEEGSQDRAFTDFKIVPDGPLTLSMFVDIIDVPQADYTLETYGLDPNGTAISPSATWSVTPADKASVDPNGVFRTTNPGRYRVTATSVLDTSISDTVDITVLERAMTVQGTVTTQEGTPVVGATITVEEVNLTTKTDSDGHYVLYGVPAASVITVRAEYALRSGETTVAVDDPTQPVEVNIVITASAITPFTTLTPGGGTGNVSGQTFEYDGTTPMGNTFVAFYSISNPNYNSSSSLTGQASPNLTTTADGGGNFSFTGVPSGQCRVEFWRSEADYNSDPANPAGAANDSVISGGTITVYLKSGIVPTSVPTLTPTPGAVWSIQNNTGQTLNDVYFVDDTYGWAGGEAGQLFRTTNGGSIWQSLTTPLTPIYGVHFIDANTGFICGNYSSGAAEIRRTTNGGSGWDTVAFATGSTGDVFYGIYFLDSNYGWTTGNFASSSPEGACFLTTNGGASSIDWSPSSPMPSSPPAIRHPYSVHFINSSNGWIAGADDGDPANALILRSTNGGVNWSTEANGPEGQFRDIYVVDSTHGWAVGETSLSAGIIYFYNGSSWTLQETTGNSLYGVHFLDINTGWAVGANGDIYNTVDGGITWNAQNSGVSGTILKSVYFVDENTGWAVGGGGLILHYSQ